FSFFICIFRHHKKHRPSDIYYIRKAVPTIAKPCKSRALSTVCFFKNIQKYWNILMGLLPCISRGVILDERCKRTEAE
ncbi:hypothetical protein, partial [Blautia obeum]|uniref:hypothetical protein n=1 Tax=Blautia obeum TaxID=40520 RepID=UPI001D069EA0